MFLCTIIRLIGHMLYCMASIVIVREWWCCYGGVAMVITSCVLEWGTESVAISLVHDVSITVGTQYTCTCNVHVHVYVHGVVSLGV